MTDNANTFLIYEISDIDGIQRRKRRIAKKIILNYIADERFPDLFYEGNNDLSGKNTPIANFSYIRCIKLDFGAE